MLAKVNSTSTLGGVSLHSVLTEAGPCGAESSSPGDTLEPDKRSADVRGMEQEDPSLPHNDHLSVTSSRLSEGPSIPSAENDFIIPHSPQAQELEGDIITGIPRALTNEISSVKQPSTSKERKDPEMCYETAQRTLQTTSTKEKKPKHFHKRLAKPVGKFLEGTLIATGGIVAVAFFPVTIGIGIYIYRRRRKLKRLPPSPAIAYQGMPALRSQTGASPHLSEFLTADEGFPGRPYRSADIPAELPARFELGNYPVDTLVSRYTQDEAQICWTSLD